MIKVGSLKLKDERPYFKFEKLQIRQHARKFSNEIYRVTGQFSRSEQFGVTNQLRRAAASVALNVAEGSERKSNLDFQRFLRMAIASLNEVVSALYLSLDQKFVEEKNFYELRVEASYLAAQLKSFIKAFQ